MRSRLTDPEVSQLQSPSHLLLISTVLQLSPDGIHPAFVHSLPPRVIRSSYDQ